jgi:excisionase family DNA binding protein
MPAAHSNAALGHSKSASPGRITVLEVAQRLGIGRLTVYEMLEHGIIPSIRLGRRWIITRHAYEHWERTCGERSGAGLRAQPEVMVLN